MANIPVQNGQLPQGFCPPDYQTMLNAFTATQFVAVNAIAGLVVSSTPPADHTSAWLQLDSKGNPVRLYWFAGGAWLSLHPQPPGAIMPWLSALPNFTTFDGGDNTAAPYSAISGQMWQLAAATLDGLSVAPLNDMMNGRVPVGVGTFPSGSTIGLQAQTGEDLHKLIAAEMPPHGHFEQIGINRAVPNGGQIDNSGNGGFAGTISTGGVETFTRITGGDPASGNPPTVSLGHNNIQPSTGLYFLQRTQRLFYVVHP